MTPDENEATESAKRDQAVRRLAALSALKQIDLIVKEDQKAQAFENRWHPVVLKGIMVFGLAAILLAFVIGFVKRVP